MKYLFRGQTEDGVWVEGGLVALHYPKSLNIAVEGDNQNWSNTIFHRVIPKSVGMFWSNHGDTDIFDGDIVEISGEEPFSNGYITTDYFWKMTGEIKFDGCAFGFVEKREKTITIYLTEFEGEDIDIKKLGTVTDNPELLQEG